jgi:hypothetical protein
MCVEGALEKANHESISKQSGEVVYDGDADDEG